MTERDALYEMDEYNTGEYVENDSHIPGTEAIRATYATDYYMTEVSGRGTPEGRAAAFDRWLATVKAAAWDEGWYAHEIWDGSEAERANPYRVAGDKGIDHE